MELTEGQVKVLRIIQNKPACMTDATTLLGTTIAASSKIINNLHSMGLIEPFNPGDGTKYSITKRGHIALQKIDIQSSQKVEPRSYHYTGESYLPEKNIYYRNNGNKHIQSRGF